MSATEKLTDKEFWDNYWGSISIPQIVSTDVSFERGLIQSFRKNLGRNYLGKEILEIGCAPGKWLAFYANELGLIPSGIDYSSSGIEATKRNLKMLGVNFKNLDDKDFFAVEPDYQYDVVVSLGFIEHFDNPLNVIDLHLKWLKPGGKLIIGVPNFRGINEYIQKRLGQDILDKHNLDTMNFNFFEQVTTTFSLTQLSLDYVGGFEPTLFIDTNQAPSIRIKILNKMIEIAKKIRGFTVTDRLNHPKFSGYILYTAEKKYSNE